MKLRLSNESMQLKLDSTDILEFQDIFKAYNLVMRTDADLSVTDNNDDQNDDKDADEAVVKPVPNLKASYLSNSHEKVKASIRCRKCGFVGVHEVHMGDRFTNCPKCHVKLFLRPANVEWGSKDSRGMTYKAEEVYIPSNRFTHVDEGNELVYSTKEPVPDEYSSVDEIEKYLDKHHVNHDGIHLKTLLVDKLKDVKYSDK